MFVVHGTFPIKPDAVEDLKSALAGLQAATRTENGCLSYEWSESVETPGTFYSIETWESRDALETHLATEHVKAAVANLPGWLGGQPALVGYEAAGEIALPL
jgi:quinol monooxygenase YgiN